LIELENNLLQRLLRLQTAEARLANVVWQTRRRGGRRAVQQIERERQRLGRELHTGVGQLLAAITMQVDILQNQIPDRAPPVEQALRHIGLLAAEALDQVRSLSRRVHPPEWQRLSLDAALRQLWEISGIAQRFAGEVRLPTPALEVDPELKTLLYRATQEALSNIIRHSRASRVDLTLEQQGDRLVLTIHDNGVGFDPARVFSGLPDIANGLGLRAIREHASALGGKLLVQSGPLGTTLEISVPV